LIATHQDEQQALQQRKPPQVTNRTLVLRIFVHLIVRLLPLNDSECRHLLNRTVGLVECLTDRQELRDLRKLLVQQSNKLCIINLSKHLHH